MKDVAFKERQKELLVIRLFLFIVFGTGLFAAAHWTIRTVTQPVTTQPSSQATMSGYWFIGILGVLCGVPLTFLALRAIILGIRESLDHNRMVRRADRQIEQPIAQIVTPVKAYKSMGQLKQEEEEKRIMRLREEYRKELAEEKIRRRKAIQDRKEEKIRQSIAKSDAFSSARGLPTSHEMDKEARMNRGK